MDQNTSSNESTRQCGWTRISTSTRPVQDTVRFNAFKNVASCFVDDYEGVAKISHLQEDLAKLLPSGYTHIVIRL